MTDPQTFILPPPFSTNALRCVARGRIIDSPEYRAWKVRASEELRLVQRAHKRGTADPVQVTLRIPDASRIDCDNAAKSALDALQSAGVIADDRQVRRLVIEYHVGDFTATVERFPGRSIPHRGSVS